MIAAILSSNVDMAVQQGVCLSGEVGLSGEIRPVTRMEQRVREADKLGMRSIIIPRGALKGVELSRLNIEVVEVTRVEEAFRRLFG